MVQHPNRRGRNRKRRRPVRKNPASEFLNNVLDMLDTAVSTMVFGGGAILLGKILGHPGGPPRIDIPPGVPREVVDEWGRLAGYPLEESESKPVEGVPAGRKSRPKGPKVEAPIELVKGEDGVYRPKGEA